MRHEKFQMENPINQVLISHLSKTHLWNTGLISDSPKKNWGFKWWKEKWQFGRWKKKLQNEVIAWWHVTLTFCLTWPCKGKIEAEKIRCERQKK